MKIEEIIKKYYKVKDKLGYYIEDYVNFLDDEVLENLEFDYTGEDETDEDFTFYSWLESDYITIYNKSLIEQFIDESNNLTKKEIKILEGRNNSYVNIYQVVDTQKNDVKLYDFLNEKYLDIKVFNGEFKNGDIILTRIANILGYNLIVGTCHYLNEKLKDILLTFMKESLKVIDKEKGLKDLSRIEKLKMLSKGIYEYLEKLINGEKDSKESKVSPIDIFGMYLVNEQELKEETVNKHMENLYSFYEIYYKNENKAIEDMTGKDVDTFIKEGIEINYLLSKTAINSHIVSLKKFSKFLFDYGHLEKKAYKSIVKISKQRDKYIKRLDYEMNYENVINFKNKNSKDIDSVFNYNNTIKDILKGYEVKERFIKDFYVFLNYIKNEKPKVAKTNKNLKKKDIKNLNDLIINKGVKEIDITYLDIFYRFSLYYNIIDIDNKIIKLDDGLNDFNEYDNYEKLAIFIDYIFNKFKLDKYIPNKNFILLNENNKFKYIKEISKLKENEKYFYDTLEKIFINSTEHPINKNFHIFNFVLFNIFKNLNLVEYDLYDTGKDKKRKIKSILIKPMGKAVFKVLTDNKEKVRGKVINLFD
ncbi:MAG: hypothetical protein FH753_11375 [Firmicutes bacterium]|nr:hypothetical protein [Bacillota bacterium]